MILCTYIFRSSPRDSGNLCLQDICSGRFLIELGSCRHPLRWSPKVWGRAPHPWTSSWWQQSRHSNTPSIIWNLVLRAISWESRGIALSKHRTRLRMCRRWRSWCNRSQAHRSSPMVNMASTWLWECLALDLASWRVPRIPLWFDQEATESSQP